MKPFFASTLFLLALPLCAQTSSSSTAATTTTTVSAPTAAQASGAESAAMASPVLSTLTPEEKTKLMSLHSQVIQQSPDLKKEEMDLMQRGMAMQASEPSDADRQAFMTEARAHADKVRAAMVKADPSVQALFAKITAQAEKMKAQGQMPH